MTSCRRKRSRGFNLIEVMVALIVISVGMLGIAKMQALAMSSAGTAKMRSLAALQASSLASTLRADRAYWSAIPATVTVTFQNGAITASTDAGLQAVTTCNSAAAPCTPTQIAAYDLQSWITALATQMPTHQATLTCTVPATQPAPTTCSIALSWTENRVGVNKQGAGQTLAAAYNLYVQP